MFIFFSVLVFEQAPLNLICNNFSDFQKTAIQEENGLTLVTDIPLGHLQGLALFAHYILICLSSKN